MTVSKISICNLALAKIGERPIASLDENNQAARYCKVFYDASRNAVLREYTWNFATINRELASVVVPDGYSKWAYGYGYPQDCLRIQEVHDDGGNEFPYEVSVYASGTQKLKIILVNVQTAYLRYIVEITNPELFDSQFIEAFALYLAKELAWPVIKSHAAEQAMFQKYQMSIPKAQASDAKEQTVEIITTDPWITDRLAQ